jgi:hypothetical protein
MLKFQQKAFIRHEYNMEVNQKVKAIFKLCGNRDREELPHHTVLTMPLEVESKTHQL